MTTATQRGIKFRLPGHIEKLFPLGQADLSLSPATVAEILAAWVFTVALDRPTKPILLFTGPPGSGKTSMARGLVRLLEGPGANVIVVPKTPQDLLIVASKSRFVALDNVESRGWLPDVLSATATGASFAGRKLYTDAEIAVVEIKAGLILTSMDVPFSRADVLDRCIIFPMTRLKSFRPEAEVQNRFDEARPAFTKALEKDLTALRPALERDGTAETILRMADFATIGRLVWGDRADSIMEAIVTDQAGLALRDDPAVDALILIAKLEPITGPAGAIKRVVASHLPERTPEMHTDRSFGDHLRRLAEPSKAFGLDITWHRDRHTKNHIYTVSWRGQ